MTTLNDPRTRSSTGRFVAAAAGASALLMAVYQVATPGRPSPGFDSVVDWTRELLFLAFLVLSVTATWFAASRGVAPRASVWLVGLGYGALALGVGAGMLLREDPEWFMVLGGPGNLLGIAGFVTWAIWAHRRRVLPLAAVLLCGAGGVLAILGSEFGSSVLIAGFWFYLSQNDR